MKVLSVNVGRPLLTPWKRVSNTGIDKQPVTGPAAVRAPGPKGIGTVGLAGDRAHDVRHHSGPDQAVYAYAREDLDEWQIKLGNPLPHGAFGENLRAGWDALTLIDTYFWVSAKHSHHPDITLRLPDHGDGPISRSRIHPGSQLAMTAYSVQYYRARSLRPGQLRTCA